MKYLSVFISSLLLSGCLSVGGFQPPKPVDSWDFPGSEEYFSSADEMLKFYQKMDKDMRSCGIDPVFGDSLYAESSLWKARAGMKRKDLFAKQRGSIMIRSV